ncbi:MAG: hypothetical protein ACRD8W_07860 [Nitrososphaeraceae archaeon]
MTPNKQRKAELKRAINDYDKRVREVTRFVPEDVKTNFINNWKILKNKIHGTLDVVPD